MQHVSEAGVSKRMTERKQSTTSSHDFYLSENAKRIALVGTTALLPQQSSRSTPLVTRTVAVISTRALLKLSALCTMETDRH